eukprot:5458855-Pleurochrysis_carterae.AAC.1
MLAAVLGAAVNAAAAQAHYAYGYGKSVSSRGDTVSAMSDQADFLARVPEGTPQGESQAASGLVGTARTPSP